MRLWTALLASRPIVNWAQVVDWRSTVSLTTPHRPCLRLDPGRLHHIIADGEAAMLEVGLPSNLVLGGANPGRRTTTSPSRVSIPGASRATIQPAASSTSPRRAVPTGGTGGARRGGSRSAATRCSVPKRCASGPRSLSRASRPARTRCRCRYRRSTTAARR